MEAVMEMEAQPAPRVLSARRDWSELPMDVLSLIFAKLGAVEILMGSGLVCHSWLDAAKEPTLWRAVDMVNHKVVEKMDEDVLCAMAKVIVDRSQGKLELFRGMYFVTDEFLNYLGDRYYVRSASLKCLGLKSCHDVTNKGFTDFITKCPLLEDLSLELCPRVGGHKVYETTGKACPQMKHFRLCREQFQFRFKYPCRYGEELGLKAMPELRSLSLIGSNLSNTELEAIVGSCPHMETLFLDGCNFVVFGNGSHLQAKCARIKTVTISQSGLRQCCSRQRIARRGRLTKKL